MKAIREFFDRKMQNLSLQYRYGQTLQSVEQIKSILSVRHDDIMLAEDVPNWQEKRGIYRVKVEPRHNSLLWLMMQPFRNDQYITMCQELNLVEWIYVHVYEDGYNHKVVIANRPDTENFRYIPNYLCVSHNFADFSVTKYLSDFETLLGGK